MIFYHVEICTWECWSLFSLRVLGPNILWIKLPSKRQCLLLGFALNIGYYSRFQRGIFTFFSSFLLFFLFPLFCPMGMSLHHVKHIYYVTMLILMICRMLLDYCNRIRHSSGNISFLCQFIRIIVMGGFVVWCMGFVSYVKTCVNLF